MFVLDTDHMSLIEWGSHGSATLRERLAEVAPEDLATTIISFEEQMRGWITYISRAKSMAQQLEGYRRLRRQLDNYRQVPVLDFDEAAIAAYEDLRRARVRVGTMDLKIAAIVLSRRATLLTRNLADFCHVPGLKVEDWSA